MFITRYGHYEYSVMLFGVTNAPGVFMKYINMNFHQYLDKFVVVLIDDILIYSNTDEEHVEHLRIMLELLEQKQLYAKLSQCEFWLRELSFIGYIIFSSGIVVDHSKVDDVLHFETLKFVTETRSFIGLAIYYHRFV